MPQCSIRIASLVWITAVVSPSAISGHAQADPSLSGDWTLESESIAKADETALYSSVFRFGSRLSIQQDEKSFTAAIWTMPIDGDSVTDATGGRWRARRQANGIVVTETHGDQSAGTNSSHSISFRLMTNGRLAVDITSDPVVEVSTVKSVYARAVKDAVLPTRPDFAGRWIVDEAASQLNGSTAWFSNDVLVSLDAKGLTVASVGSGPGTGKSVFPTDGSDVRTPSGPRGGTSLSRAEWRGNRLIATTLIYSTATDRRTTREVLRTTERRVTISLATDGALVVDVSTIPTPERIGFATRSVYRRAKS